MRKLIIILCLLFSGCSATWHFQKAIDKDPDIIKRDTITTNIITKRDTTIFLDTNITVILPRDTVRITKLLPKYINFDKVKEKNGIITVEVSAIDGKLNIISYLDSTMIYRYRDSLLIKNAIISDLRQVLVSQQVNITEKKTLIERLKSNKKTLLYIIYGVVVLFIVGLLIKFIRWIKK